MSPKINDMLIKAIESSDTKTLQELFDKIDLKRWFSQDGLVPLVHAIEHSNLRTVRLLLEAGADPDFGTLRTPLEAAIRENKFEMLNVLIEQGADINQLGEGRTTPLMTAVACKSLKVIKHLLNAGVDTSLVNEEGYTAFELANMRGHKSIAQYFIDTGIENKDIQHPNVYAMQKAANSGSFDSVVKYLDSGVSVDGVSDYSRRTILSIFAEKGDIQAVKEILERGADINLPINYRALAVAANFNNLLMMKFLLKNGFDPNCHEKGSSPPLCLACTMGHLEATKLLVNNGANLKTRDECGRTPLACAFDFEWRARERTEIVDFLLSQGLRDFSGIKESLVRELRPELFDEK